MMPMDRRVAISSASACTVAADVHGKPGVGLRDAVVLREIVDWMGAVHTFACFARKKQVSTLLYG